MQKFSGEEAASQTKAILNMSMRESSHSSWRIRTCCPPSVIQEVIRVCEVARTVPTAAKTLPHLRKELITLTKKDPVVKRYFFDVFVAIEHLQDKHRPDYWASSCEVIQLRFHSYKQRCLDLLTSCYSEEIKLSWHELFEVVQNFISSIIHWGVSQEKIQCTISETLAEVFDTQSSQVLAAIKRCMRRRATYQCWAVVKWPHAKDFDQPYQFAGIQVCRSYPESGTSAEAKFKEKIGNATGLLVSSITKARDEFSARDRFATLLAKTFSYVGLYRPKLQHVVLGNVVLVGKNESPDWRCLTSQSVHSIPMYDASEFGLRIQKLMKARKSLEYPDQQKLDAAFQHHSIALSTPVVEAKLTSLWVSLESLVDHEQTSIIESVATYVSDLAALSYLHNSVHDLCRSFARQPDYSIVRHCFNSASEYLIPEFDMLLLLCLPSNDDRVQVTEKWLGNKHALNNRFRFFRNTVLANPKDVRSRMQKEKQRVDWQVRRIYRERNEIAHRGMSGKMLPYLLSHLLAYQSQVLRTLMHDVRAKRGSQWGIEQCVKFRQTAFVTTQRMLDSRPSHITIEGLLDPADKLTLGQIVPRWKDM